jgi:predicted phage terminase large subunit-like protein
MRPRTSQIPEFSPWLAQSAPHLCWHWPYLALVRCALDDLTAGRCRRLLVCLPPRHGKSTLATIHYPAWRLEANPDTQIVVGCYNQAQAERFSRRVRALVRRRGVLTLDPERHAAADWQLAGSPGGLRAAGVGSPPTGAGADLLVIDDPIKSREEAASPAYRERCWDWYSQDLYTRLEPGGAIVLIQTRWHADDLAGRILASASAADWRVVSLPAEAEADDPLGRPAGAALCPERYPLAALADIRRELGAVAYAALYQQRPAPAEGALFKVGTTGTVDAVPAHASYCRGWDIAASAHGGDATAGVLLARVGSAGTLRWYVVDVVCGRWDTDERDRRIRATADADRAHYGAVVQWLPQDPGAAGKSQAQAFVRLLAGHRVLTAPASGAKVVRADPFSAQWNAGDGAAQWNVALVRAGWNQAYRDELCTFPFGAHDDQVDASASAFAVLADACRPGAPVAATAVSPLVTGAPYGPATAPRPAR